MTNPSGTVVYSGYMRLQLVDGSSSFSCESLSFAREHWHWGKLLIWLWTFNLLTHWKFDKLEKPSLRGGKYDDKDAAQWMESESYRYRELWYVSSSSLETACSRTWAQASVFLWSLGYCPCPVTIISCRFMFSQLFIVPPYTAQARLTRQPCYTGIRWDNDWGCPGAELVAGYRATTRTCHAIAASAEYTRSV